MLRLHHIIFFDFSENLLIKEDGHICIIDFGFAKIVPEQTFTLCGNPEYIAPEIIEGKGHGRAVDWWQLGILTYEMLNGHPPFFGENPFQVYKMILQGDYEDLLNYRSMNLCNLSTYPSISVFSSISFYLV